MFGCKRQHACMQRDGLVHQCNAMCASIDFTTFCYLLCAPASTPYSQRYSRFEEKVRCLSGCLVVWLHNTSDALVWLCSQLSRVFAECCNANDKMDFRAFVVTMAIFKEYVSAAANALCCCCCS